MATVEFTKKARTICRFADLHSLMKLLTECDPIVIDRVLASALTVHRELGPGLMESIYQHALALELGFRGLEHECQVEIPVSYRGKRLGLGFRADVIVKNSLLLEIKSVSELNSLHLAQTINYLHLLKLKRGFLINFNTRLLKQGMKRVSI